MSTTQATLTRTEQYDVATIMGGLYGDGIIALKGAFERDWVQKMREEMDMLYEAALKRPGGAVGPAPGSATTAGATFGGAAGGDAPCCGAAAGGGEVGCTFRVLDAGGPGSWENRRVPVLGPSIHGRPAASVTLSMRSERLPPAG